MLWSGDLGADILASLARVTGGFFLAVIIGTPLGIATALWRPVQLTLGPIIQFLRPIPPIAWIPLSILWFGIGEGPSYFLTMVGALFPIVLNTHFGVSGISRQHLQVARCFETSFSRRFLRVIWPAALPSILSGFRVGFGMAWMSLVGAEMIAAHSGLGYLIHVSEDLLRTERVIGGMIVIGLIGIMIDFLLRRLENHLSPWFGAET